MRTIFVALLSLGILTADLHALEAGEMAPAFKLQSLDSREMSLKDFNGKVVYLDFWASWCGPCQHTFPVMKQLQEKYGPRGFQVVAVNVDENRADAERFLKSEFSNLVILFDPKGETPEQCAVKKMPTSFLIDRHGRVRLASPGFHKEDVEKLDQEIATLLSES